MIKILSFGRSCKAYFRLYSNRSPDVSICCDDCGQKLHKHGHYLRWAVSKQNMIQIPVYRWLCPNCRKTVSLLPDFLIPWARFTTWTREAAISRKRNGFSWRRITETIATPNIGLSPRTVKRWWKRHLIQAAFTSLWIARQLVATGLEDDLLQMHPYPISATAEDTLLWLDQLYIFDAPRPSRLRGYWSFLNVRLPRSCLL